MEGFDGKIVGVIVLVTIGIVFFVGTQIFGAKESSLSCDNLPILIIPNPDFNKIIKNIEVGNVPEDATFNPTNNNMYVANLGDNNVSVIDTNTNLKISSWASACQKANESTQRAYSLLTLIIIVFAASIVIDTIVYFLLNRR